MLRKGWYIIAYDITNHKRLAKVHRILKKQALALQNSLFLLNSTETNLNRLLDDIALIIFKKEDDIRAYPINNPQAIWTNGLNPLSSFPVIYPASRKKKKKDKLVNKKQKNLWQRFCSFFK